MANFYRGGSNNGVIAYLDEVAFNAAKLLVHLDIIDLERDHTKTREALEAIVAAGTYTFVPTITVRYANLVSGTFDQLSKWVMEGGHDVREGMFIINGHRSGIPCHVPFSNANTGDERAYIRTLDEINAAFGLDEQFRPGSYTDEA